MHYFSDDMYKSTKFAFGFCRLNGNISELTYILYNLGHNRDQGGHDLMHFDIYVHVPISMQPLSGEDYSWATNPQNSTISHSTGSQVAKQQEETLSEGDLLSYCIAISGAPKRCGEGFLALRNVSTDHFQWPPVSIGTLGNFANTDLICQGKVRSYP